MTEMISCRVRHSSAADEAVRDLEAAGLPSVVVRPYVKDDPALRDYKAQAVGQKQQSFWSWVFGDDEPATGYDIRFTTAALRRAALL